MMPEAGAMMKYLLTCCACFLLITTSGCGSTSPTFGTITNSGIMGLDNAYPFMTLLLWPDARDVPAKDIRLRGETFLTPQPNNVIARQGRLVSLWRNLRYAVASIFSRDRDRSMLVRTGAFQPFG